MEEGWGPDYHLRQEWRWECQMEFVSLRFPHLRTRAELDRAWRETFGKARGKGQGDKGHKGKGKGKEAHWFSSPTAHQLSSPPARRRTRAGQGKQTTADMDTSKAGPGKGDKGAGKGKEATPTADGEEAAQQLSSLAAHQPDEGPEQARASRPQQTMNTSKAGPGKGQKGKALLPVFPCPYKDYRLATSPLAD